VHGGGEREESPVLVLSFMSHSLTPHPYALSHWALSHLRLGAPLAGTTWWTYKTCVPVVCCTA
jgi:hypothetical protein